MRVLFWSGTFWPYIGGIEVLGAKLLPALRERGYEFMVVTSAISNLIRENKTYRIDSSIQTGKKYGMQLLDEHLWNLYASGTVPPEEAIDKSRNPGEMQDKVDAHRRGMDGTDIGKKDDGEDGDNVPQLRS